ncbi:MAG TPA: CopG family transcriptional regulator [Candidatus Methylomirabilis sp.]|nr:CopG family transcriptional regulator [Candidatus Methylomirabilis sp.]
MPYKRRPEVIIAMTVYVQPAQKEALDALHARFGISRTEVLRRALDFALAHPDKVLFAQA